MKRGQISFAIAGIIFGFLLGFVVAHEIYGGRFIGVAAVAPQRGGAPMGAGSASDFDPAQGAPSMDMMDQVSQELGALKQAIQDNPEDVVALRRLGNLYMDAAMYEQANDYYRSALAVEPEDVHLRTDLATSLLMMGQAREALTELEHCVEHDPEHGKTWYWKGLAHVELGEYEEGEAAFVRALELMPGAFQIEELRAEIERVKANRSTQAEGASPS